MITARFYQKPSNGSIHMTLKGHAQTAPKGEDLVCAAATMMAYTVAQAVQFIFGDATAAHVAKGVTFTSQSGVDIDGTMKEFSGYLPSYNPSFEVDYEGDFGIHLTMNEKEYLKDGAVSMYYPANFLGEAKPEDVRAGVTFTSVYGVKRTGTALLPGGGSVYPEGAFAPVTNFTDGKQYALVAVIDGVRRYINTTTYNDYTMNATEITIREDAGDYVIFSTTPVLFTAVASGDGFLLQNGSNYLHGTSSGGTALRFGATQMVWTVDNSETGGFSDGKYYAKEDANAVWLMNADGGYSWSIKYETAGSFGYDRDGRDGTYSTGFVSFVLYEYVAGEGELNPIVDTSDATATANDMAQGKTAYVNGEKVTGTLTTTSGLIPFYSLNTSEENNLRVVAMPEQKAIIYPNPNVLVVPVPYSKFGDATAADVASGKTFTSAAGLKVTGTATVGNTGSTIKTGTTTSATIATGLSDIEQFFIYKETQTATGLIHLHYTKSATSRMYASAWSTSNYGTKTITNGTGGVTVSGGTLTLSATQAAQGALSSGVTYKWVAIGKE